MRPKSLPLSFYSEPTLQLAQSLLGHMLLKETEEGLTGGYIVETEAYLGPNDRAAHSFNHRRTKRTEIMFGEAGYVYTYTMHTHCLLNIVSGGTDEPEAVLIRAVEPYYGQDLIAQRRSKITKKKHWTNGPGKLTKALNITMDDYGHKLDQHPLWIARGKSLDAADIASGPRIGIQNSGEAKAYPWRFWEYLNTFVSK
ncbi:DNA-3-methyladenine glycosylase [Lentibacillus kimchii]|uniref:Putative 3-methyladenine DNA glycosylase n=1 Tax=Lentibacillus kimchii TaxID=1542911 RepID=A0ABW2UUF1_9BACI